MDVRLPRLGEGADSGVVATIFVKEGDTITKDQSILELESEKAVASIPAPVTGVVSRIHVKEGDQIKVGQLILSVAEAAGQADAPRVVDARVGDEEPDARPAPVAAPAAPRVVATAAAPPAGLEGFAVEPSAGVEPAASPTVRKLARELGIDLTRVKGSERGGRIVVSDLKRYIEGLQQALFARASAPVAAAAEAPARPAPKQYDFTQWGPVQTKRLSTLRKTISQKMVESWTSVPHVTQFDQADITAVLDLRKKYAAAYEGRGARLTLTSFALKAIVHALQQHPIFNASLDEVAGEMVMKEYYHIGIAVDTEHGLIVPVIRNVNTKSMLELSRELQDLATRTRERKISLEEMQGATFSISNQGGIGSGHFTPIINTPELAILGLGKGVTTPVYRDGAVVPRVLLPVSLSYDHRLIDGADAARFMVDLVKAFEQFPEDAMKTE